MYFTRRHQARRLRRGLHGRFARVEHKTTMICRSNYNFLEYVQCPEDAYSILDRGARNRSTASTDMNRESSRSHSIFTLYIQSKTTKDNVIDVRESLLNLVDLAGSERQKLTGTTGVRLKEAGKINKSLLALGNVINALNAKANGKTRHAPYRDSKLTLLLKDSLGGNSKTYLVANVSPSGLCYGETLSTLRFADRAKMIKNNAVLNQNIEGDMKTLQTEVRRLKDKLISYEMGGDMNHGKENANSDLYTVLRTALQRQVTAEADQQVYQGKVATLEECLRRKDEQTRHDKMVIRFRDSSIGMMKKDKKFEGGPPDQDKVALEQEITGLRKLLECNPEVTRFAYESLQLKEKLAKFEKMEQGLNELVEADAKQKDYERAMTAQLLEVKLENLKLKEHVQRIAAGEGKLEEAAEGAKLLEVRNFATSWSY